MTPEQIQLVQTSLAHCPALAAAFYRRLFESAPPLRTLFHQDMRYQELKFTAMLDTLVENLGHVDTLVPQIRRLGSRHVTYGVQDSFYETVEAALLSALEEQLGESFTPEVKAAWAAVYSLVATVMKEARTTDPFSRNI